MLGCRLYVSSLILLLLCESGNGADQAAAPAVIQIERPVPYQVIQREGFQARDAHSHSTVPEAKGFAWVEIAGTMPRSDGELQFRHSSLVQPSREEDWHAVPTWRWEGNRFEAKVDLAAGGWYRLELRFLQLGKVVAAGKVEPIGVGEVFLIAGQSYAAGANDALLEITDPGQRAAALDVETGKWSVANDPQPNVGDGGTIWPALANYLLPVAQVPVGFVNVAVGATSSRQWLPGTPLYANLVKAAKSARSFRAVLWQQGESDVIERVTTTGYLNNLRTIRQAWRKDVPSDAPWILAKSTLHPTVYNELAAEAEIRQAVDRLWIEDGFAVGPDTDILDGEFRGGPGSRRHFSAAGQEVAGQMWGMAVWNEILRQSDEEGRPLRWQQETTPTGNRYAISRASNSMEPAVFVLGTGIEDMIRNQRLTEVGAILAARGVTVITLDPPCHGKDQKADEPEGLSGWRYRLDREDDIVASFCSRATDILDHLIERESVEEGKVAVCGTSRGGFLALHWAGREPRVGRAVGFSPVTDLAALREFEGIKEGSLASQLALKHHTDSLAGKGIWLTIGNQDERVGTNHALEFITLLLQSGTQNPSEPNIWLSVVPSRGHATPAGAHRRAAEWILSSW